VGLLEKNSSQFVDLIEWPDLTPNQIAYRFERYNNSVKMGAKLIVRPGQVAVFVNDGQVADVFQPGMYELSTRNLPILSTLCGWKDGLNAPFKVDVYFFNTTVFTDLNWETSNPLIIHNTELGSVSLCAYGTYNLRVSDPAKLVQQLVSIDGLFPLDEIKTHWCNRVVNAFANWIRRGQISLFDFAAYYPDMGEQARIEMQPEIQQWGLELTQLLIENISLPPEVEEALDQQASIGVIENLSPYTQYQGVEAIAQSAQNPSDANSILDLGISLDMSWQRLRPMQSQSPQTSQPPISQPTQWYIFQNDQQLGPFTLEELAKQELTAQTQVWKTGMSGWQPAREIRQLASILPSAASPLPPIQWYIIQNEQPSGPFVQNQLLQQGLTAQTQVWKAGMTDWQPAGEQPELSSLIASASLT
jgi:membrane protease subunit (stomatin/prohibitin family)